MAQIRSVNSKKKNAARHEFEKTVMQHLDALYGLGLSLARNKADAEDLVQESVLKALRAQESFKQGTNLKAWLFTILRNTFINEYRRRQKTVLQPAETEEDSEFSFYEAAMNRLQAKGNNREVVHPDALEPSRLEHVLGDEVTKALAVLSDEFREVIYLCDVQELSYEEIAGILAVPIGTVRSRLARARHTLQKLLWNYANDKGLFRKAS